MIGVIEATVRKEQQWYWSFPNHQRNKTSYLNLEIIQLEQKNVDYPLKVEIWSR